MIETEKQQADVVTSEETIFHIKRSQVPLHCPLPEMSLWNQHPRVYLPIEETGKAKCPYCGSEFILDND